MRSTPRRSALPAEIESAQEAARVPGRGGAAADAREPHHVAYYLREVAGLWNPYVQDGVRPPRAVGRRRAHERAPRSRARRADAFSRRALGAARPLRAGADVTNEDRGAKTRRGGGREDAARVAAARHRAAGGARLRARHRRGLVLEETGMLLDYVTARRGPRRSMPSAAPRARRRRERARRAAAGSRRGPGAGALRAATAARDARARRASGAARRRRRRRAAARAGSARRRAAPTAADGAARVPRLRPPGAATRCRWARSPTPRAPSSSR